MGITSSREYMGSITVNLSQAKQIATAQRETYAKGLVKLSSNSLATALGTVATVLGLIFVTSTPAGVVAGVTGILSALLPNAEDDLRAMVADGNDGLQNIITFLEKNPKYTSVEMKLPFIEYVVDGRTIRFVTGKGYPVRVRTSSGWITM